MKRGDVVECGDSEPPFFHFQVKQRSGRWSDVYYAKNLKTKQMEWSCCAVRHKKNGDSWTCAMNSMEKRDRPYCSHTLAAKMYMQQCRGQGKP